MSMMCFKVVGYLASTIIKVVKLLISTNFKNGKNYLIILLSFESNTS